MRLKALERLGETGKRKKDQEDGKGQKKSRRSGGDTIQYLREKSEQEMKLREKDQELEKSKQEEEKRKNDATTTTTTATYGSAGPAESSHDENV